MSSSNGSPWTAQRVVAGIAALLLIALSILILLKQLRTDFEDLWLALLVGVPCVTAAILCGWFALQGQFAGSRAKMRYALLAGLILGGISFAAGFFGPMILTPNSNQGPMLGIFVTGPIGFVVGVVLGAIVGGMRTDEPPSDGVW